MLAAGVCLGLSFGAGMTIGTRVAVRSPLAPPPSSCDTLLHATASHSGRTLAMATGLIDSDIEGLFLLDYLTGDLRCSVLSNRTRQWIGAFQHNVIADLGIQQGKAPDFLMVTGRADFQRGAALTSPARCAVYVADAKSGNYAVYTILWNPTAARADAFQRGTFALLQTGNARVLPIRD
jgi:hypothetical protein